MRTTMSRRPRAAAVASAGALLASGLAVAAAPAASASTCAGRFCGAVKNRTGRTMSITENLGSGTGYCDVWNWQGGPGSSWMHSHCTQKTWGNGQRGGNGTGVDVDAFTFSGEGYHERFSRVGSWHWRVHGVWTKIRSGEIADCGIGAGKQIWCTVLWQVA
jgi:hypothetical protein